MRKFILPKRIVESENVENVSSLLKRKPLQIGLAENDCLEVKGKGYIILDFGEETRGGVRILTFRADGGSAKVRIRFGESLSEASSTVGVKGETNDHSPRDLEYLLVNYSDEKIADTGYRFIRIDFLEDKKLTIKNVYGESIIFSAKPKNLYSGKDKEIKEIFDVAKRTVDLCSAGKYIWDGIKRDRLVWIGDIHPEMLALTSIYGRVPIIERSLDFVKDQTPLPTWMNGFPMYSMWWMIIVADYYEFTGAKEFSKKQIPYMLKLIEMMDGCVTDKGELAYPSYFVDWPTHNQKDELAGVRAINIIALNKAVSFLKKFGIETPIAKESLKKLKKIPIGVVDKKQVVALKYFAEGKLSDKDYNLLIKDGAKGVSTFMSYYILTAIASKDKKKAVEIMKEYYGAMLKKGATSFWEDFDMNWAEGSGDILSYPKDGEKDIHADFGAYCYLGYRHSLCHGWSSGVARFILENCK